MNVMPKGQRFSGAVVISDVLAGAIIAASNVALAAGFTAVIFQGEMKAGFPTAMWSILVSMIVVGVIVGFLTTLPPVVAGSPDTAVVAVLSLLASSISAPLLASGMQVDLVVTHVLAAITVMTLLYGLLLWGLGTLGWAKALRFVPYPLVGGFLASTGFLLLKSSPEIVLDEQLSFAAASVLWDHEAAPQLWFMLAFFTFLVLSHHLIRSPFVMPVSFFVAVGLCDAGVHLGYIDGSDWFLGVSQGLQAWVPVVEMTSGRIDWTAILMAAPEIIACILVGLFSLVVRISTIEAMRQETADINGELRSYGLANLTGVGAGAMSGGILFSSSRLIQVAGYRTPLCYLVMAALLLVIVGLGTDLSALLPKAVLGGLLLYLGYTMSLEAIRVVFRHPTPADVIVTVAIITLCLNLGFIAGAIFGLVAACLMFALDCSRTGVIRRHLTRAGISGGTEWPHDVEDFLRKHGDSVHVYELSGYLFFGSSEDLFDNIRSRVLSQKGPPIRFVILDLTRVSGHDSSASNTLIKLQGFATRHGFRIVYCGLSPSYEAVFEKAGIISRRLGAMSFPTRLEAMYWCENLMLEIRPEAEDLSAAADFRKWISEEIGTAIDEQTLDEFFCERRFRPGEEIYAQGTPSDTIDFIYSGSVLMKLNIGGEAHAIRRSTRRTVIGEMGFFRDATRSVSIFADEALVMYSLSREGLESIQRAAPDVHANILSYIIRVLADRVEMANREISVLR